MYDSVGKTLAGKKIKCILQWAFPIITFVAGFVSSNYLLERKAYANFPHYQLTASLGYLSLFRDGDYENLERLLESELNAGVAGGVKIKECILSDYFVGENFDKKLLAAINYMELHLDTFSGRDFTIRTNPQFSNRVARVKQNLQSQLD